MQKINMQKVHHIGRPGASPGAHRIGLFITMTFMVAVVAAAIFLLALANSPLLSPTAIVNQPDQDFAAEEVAMLDKTAVEPELLTYLQGDFCDFGLCRSGSWAEWIILSPDSTWTVEELKLLRRTMIITITALDDAGLDGANLLSGYRFRRARGIYLNGKLGTVAHVLHGPQEIVLADGALTKEWGFYLYHELGHVVDRRLDYGLTREFQRLTLSENGIARAQTADGFWLDQTAKNNPREAAADAFALWVILEHSINLKPVFWMKPAEVHYDTITAVIDNALHGIAQRKTVRKNAKNFNRKPSFWQKLSF